MGSRREMGRIEKRGKRRVAREEERERGMKDGGFGWKLGDKINGPRYRK